MSISDEDIAFVTDHFSEAGPISTRKIFGGLAIYADGAVFALLMGSGNIMLKAKGGLAQALQDKGCKQFIYNTKSKTPTAMPYWTLPDAAMDDHELACGWARGSLRQNS
jgi:DNA transformation protein